MKNYVFKWGAKMTKSKNFKRSGPTVKPGIYQAYVHQMNYCIIKSTNHYQPVLTYFIVLFCDAVFLISGPVQHMTDSKIVPKRGISANCQWLH